MTVAEFCKKQIWLWCVAAPLIIVAYAPVYPRMARDWMADPNYSHGFLVPFVSAWFVYLRLEELKALKVDPDFRGILLMISGLLLLFMGVAADELFTSRASSIVLLAGAVYALWGARALRILALPLVYLMFMVPLPYTLYDMLALPLKSLVSWLATSGIGLLGIPVLREGNMILLPNISLEVVDACSGLRSLTSLIALGVAYAFLFLGKPWQRAVLILATIPIAVFTNALRVFITGVLARHAGAAAAEGFFHDFAGLTVFVVAMALTALTGFLLDTFSRQAQGGPHAP